MSSSVSLSPTVVALPVVSTDRPPRGRIYTPLPRMWVGLIPAVLCLFFQLAGASAVGLVWFVSMAGTCYWFFCVHRIHKVLSEYTRSAYPVSPRRAVGFHFIPLFEYYWFFRWTRQLSLFLRNEPNGPVISQFWPGLLLITASIVGWFVSLKSLRLFLIFGLGMYLVRKLRGALPKCAPLCVNRPQQWNLSLSAGVGATVSFVLVQALRHFYAQEPGQKFDELAAIFVVSVGVMIFLEPLFDRLRVLLGVAEHHRSERSHKPWLLRLAVLAIIAFTSLFHGLMHSEIEDRFQHDFMGTLTVLLTGMLVTGGITYFWIAAAHRHPSHAGRSGLLSGAVLGFVVASTVLTAVSPTEANAHADSYPGTQHVVKDLQEGRVQEAIAHVLPHEYPFLPGRLVKDVEENKTADDDVLAKICIVALPWPIFGLIGGVIIDKKWGKNGRNGIVPTIALSMFAAATLYAVGLWRMRQTTGFGEILSHISIVAGWGLALVICSSATILTPEEATEPVLQTVA
jgi:hypothetical protein